VTKIRVLIVDDSAVMRRIIKRMIETDPEIEAVGLAKDGAEGIDMAMALSPDVITMDIEMPRMDGLEATAIIMEKRPTPIIMVSALTHECAKATFDAMDKGAADYIPKSLAPTAADLKKMQDDIIGKVKAVVRKRNRLYGLRAFRRPERTRAEPRRARAAHRAGFVAIGASTGGPRAIQEVLARLPGDLSTPFLVAIHMPKTFTRAFAERLDELCKLSVKEAENGEKVVSGRVLLTPGGVQTMLRKANGSGFYVEVSDEPRDTLYKPCVDISMSSVAECYHSATLGVILTGMGSDGKEGMRLIKEYGGMTIAQDEETSTVYGMPRAVVEAGLADRVVPLDRIADEIVGMA
jgi:two-component system chemotaxis response regulator CheB